MFERLKGKDWFNKGVRLYAIVDLALFMSYRVLMTFSLGYVFNLSYNT